MLYITKYCQQLEYLDLEALKKITNIGISYIAGVYNPKKSKNSKIESPLIQLNPLR